MVELDARVDAGVGDGDPARRLLGHLAAPLLAIIEEWAAATTSPPRPGQAQQDGESAAAPPAPDHLAPPRRSDHGSELLGMLSPVAVTGGATGGSDLADFERAVTAGDPIALQRYSELLSAARHGAELAWQRLDSLFRAGDLVAARAEGPTAGKFAAAVGHPLLAVRAYLACAKASVRLGSADTAIGLFRRALALTAHCSPVPRRERSVCHSGLAAAYDAVDRLDDALAEITLAQEWEDEGFGKLQLANNKGEYLLGIGEYALAENTHRAVLGQLDQLDRPPDRAVTFRAVVLDNWASDLSALGDVDAALRTYRQVALTLPADDLADRCINALNQSQTFLTAGNRMDSGRWFGQAWSLAEQMAGTVDLVAAQRALDRHIARLVGLDSDVFAMLTQAQIAYAAGRRAEAYTLASQAAAGAGAAGDLITEVRAVAVGASALADTRDPGNARTALGMLRELLDRVRPDGTPQLIALLTITLTALQGNGVDTAGSRLDLLVTSAQGIAFGAAALALDPAAARPADPRLPGLDPGVLLGRIAKLADQAGATALAVGMWRRALASTPPMVEPIRSINRSVGLLAALATDGDSHHGEVRTLADSLRARLCATPDPGDRARILTLRALAGLPGTPAAQAVDDLQAAAAIVDHLRSGMGVTLDRGRPTGAGRAALDREYDIQRPLVRALIRAQAPPEVVFAALQGMRARALMEDLAARAGTTPYRPPTAAHARALLLGCPTPTTLVDITVTDLGLRAYLLDEQGLRSVDAVGDTAEIDRAQFGDVGQRAREVLTLVRTSPVITDLVARIHAGLPDGAAILLAVDDGLANLPWHAAALGDGCLVDAVSVGRIPAVGGLAFTPTGRRWSGDSLVAGDSGAGNARTALAGAALECRKVAGLLQVPALLGRDCTEPAIRAALHDRDLDVVHLAGHGRADVRNGGRSSLLLADPAGGTRWIAFDDLTGIDWRCDLVVFSGCSTAVGGPRDGVGLYGVAQSAAAAGAPTVLASLWPVDDQSTRVFMVAFYQELVRRRSTQPVIDVRQVLDHARAVLRTSLGDPPPVPRTRDGRDLVFAAAGLDAAGKDSPGNDTAGIGAAAPTGAADLATWRMLQWSAFVVMGDPALPGSSAPATGRPA